MFKKFRNSLIAKMILSGGVTLLVCIVLWTAFNVYYFKRDVLANVTSDIGMVSDTIKLALHYAMMLDSEEDIKENINNISKQEEIEDIRVYNKEGRIVFSNKPEEVGRVLDRMATPCRACHQYDPPPPTMPPAERTRVFSVGNRSFMSIMTPIANVEGCSPGPCHVHSDDEQVLGLLDVTMNMDGKNAMILMFERVNLGIAVVAFATTFLALFAFSYRFIFRPIKRLIAATGDLGAGQEHMDIAVEQADEIGTLGEAFNRMSRRVLDKHGELLEQREEYRNLFDNVPCLVSVVDTDYRVIRHNLAYERHFGPPCGKRCWQVHKGRLEKCEVCSVDRTFKDGQPHMSEESGWSKDGAPIHWIVYTSPVRDAAGEVVAAMEMMVDISRRKELMNQLAASEQRYHAIFDSIPNAVFVLSRETLEILDANKSSQELYGWTGDELRGRSFMDFFRAEEAAGWEEAVRTWAEIELCTHVVRSGQPIFVFISISPGRFEGRETLIVTCTDVSRKVEAEQQLIQASKMTTLGEMSTGVAHELNQPLTILKTIANLLGRKVGRNETPDMAMLAEMSEGISAHVDRAAKIIEHMREFGRKSDLRTMPVQVNEVLERGFEFFSRQLMVHNIVVQWDLEEDLPLIMADSNRLEQVVINLLLNARDAIEERWSGTGISRGAGAGQAADKRILLSSYSTPDSVVVRICDTGPGIPAAIRDRLFEPFFTTKNVGKGTGLGLSISYGIVTDYGGDIRTASWESEGACFELVFPRAECCL